MRSLQRKCGDSVADRIRNKEINRMVGSNKNVTVKNRKTCSDGHVERMSSENGKKDIQIKSGKGGKGRPR